MKKLKNLRRFVSIVLVLSFISFGTVMASAVEVPHHVVTRLYKTVVLYIGNPMALINREETYIDKTNKDVYPIVTSGRTLVPIRFISEALGAKVDWDSASSTATIMNEGKDIKLTLGSNKMLVDGKAVVLDVSAATINDRLFIPLRALVEALGKEVFYHNGLIIISEIPNIYDATKDQACINAITNIFIKDTRQIDKLKNDAMENILFGRYSNAAVIANQIIKIDPASPVGYFVMAEVFNMGDRDADAIEWYLKAIEADKEYIDAYYSLGFSLIDLELYEDAIDVFNNIISLAPTYVSAYNIKASILIDLERYEEAVDVYNKMIKLYADPDFYYYKGKALYSLERYDEAIVSFDEAIKGYNNDDQVHIEKSFALHALDRFEEAIECVNIAINIYESYEGYFYKAVYLGELGRFTEAIEVLDFLMLEFPEYSYSSLYLKNMVLEAMNK